MNKELLQQALDEARSTAIIVFTHVDGIAQETKDAIEYMYSLLGTHFERQALAQQEQPAKTERQIRRMFCATYASDSSPYMDDGEAQDNSRHPCIDFLRDSPEQIRSKMVERAIAKHKAQQEQPSNDVVTDEENERFSRDVSNFKGADPEATKYALAQFLKNRAKEQPAQEPDPVLCKFYQVTTFEELVSAQEYHINKLQAKLKKENDNGMGSILVRKSRAASDQWSGCAVVGCVASESQTGQVAKAQKEQPAQEPFKWYDGAPPFPQNQESFIAQTICGERVVLRVLPEEYTYDYTTADGTHMKAENIKKWMQFPDCQFLPPEPAPARPAIKDDIGVACLETMVKTMTNLGLATDASLEGFGARLEHNIYAMCRAVDGIFKAQPALSDEQILDIFSKVSADGMGHYMLAVGRAIEAHCRGGAKHG